MARAKGPEPWPRINFGPGASQTTSSLAGSTKQIVTSSPTKKTVTVGTCRLTDTAVRGCRVPSTAASHVFWINPSLKRARG